MNKCSIQTTDSARYNTRVYMVLPYCFTLHWQVSFCCWSKKNWHENLIVSTTQLWWKQYFKILDSLVLCVSQLAVRHTAGTVMLSVFVSNCGPQKVSQQLLVLFYVFAHRLTYRYSHKGEERKERKEAQEGLYESSPSFQSRWRDTKTIKQPLQQQLKKKQTHKQQTTIWYV